MKNRILVLVITIIFLCYAYSNTKAQTYISTHLTGNYWQHTELVGVGVGIGVIYKFRKVSISADYSYGYGAYHRFKKFDNINYDHWTTVLVDENQWSSTLGIGDYVNESKAQSDYGKQHQLSFNVSIPIVHIGKNKLNLGFGVYSSLVEHFFTFTNISVYDLDITPFYRGSLNYIPVSHQKFLTCGTNTTISYDISMRNNTWTPYIDVGFGPKYSSYASLGVQLSTKLRKKNKIK